MARRDVELVVRAKNEASRAITSISDALAQLADAQTEVADGSSRTGSQLAQLAGVISTINKTFAQVDAAVAGAEAAFARQQRTLAATETEYQSLKNQAERAAEAIVSIRLAMGNGDTEGQLAQQLRAAQVAYRELNTQADRAGASIQKQQADLARASEAMRGTQNAAIAASMALNALGDDSERAALQATAARQKEIASLRDQEAAARATAEAKEALARFDKFMGVTDKPSTPARESAAVFQESIRLQEQAAAATKKHTEELKALAVAERQAAEAADLMAAIRKNTGVDAGGGKSARESASVFQQADADAIRDFELAAKQARQEAQAAARAEEEMAEAAARLRAQLDPLAVVENRLAKELLEVDRLFKAGKISATELANAQKMLRANADAAAQALKRQGAAMGRGEAGKPSLFGLKPYELTNLGYQINDVFTQLASGTSLTQTLAQQGGQILQLFPRLGATIVGNLGRIAVAVGPVIVAFMSLRRAMQIDAEARAFSAQLTASADGANYQADALVKASKAIKAYGVEAESASKVINAFVKEGIDPARLEEFGYAAQNLAELLGQDVVEAAKSVATAFSGGYDAIVQFDKATNFLTATEREHIRTLFESGNAEQARAEAFRIFAQRQQDAADKARGPWTNAVRSLGRAWNGFLDLLANSPIIQTTAHALAALAGGVAAVLDRINGNQALPDLQKDIELQERAINDLVAAQDRLRKSGDKASADRLDMAIERARRVLAELREQEKKLQGDSAPGAQKAVTQETEAQKKAREEILSTIQKERDALKEVTDLEKVRLAGVEAELQARREGLDDVRDKELIAARKRLAIEKEIERQRKSINYGTLSEKIIGIESSGDPNAKNPRSTATGGGQFIESTWLALFKKHYPEQAAQLGTAAILELRKDQQVTKNLVEAYARENADVLQKAGVAVNEASVYLAHFLGPNGAVKVLKAAADTPIEQLLDRKAIAANPEVLGGGKTAGDVAGWARKKVGETDSERAAIQDRIEAERHINDILEQRAKKQREFNDEINREIEKRLEAAADEAEKFGLQGEALIAKEREIYAENAVADARRKANELSEDGVQISKEQEDAIRAAAQAEFDAANKVRSLQEQRKAAEQDYNDLLQQRQLLQEQIETASQLGQTSLVGELSAKLDDVNLRLAEAAQKAMEFWDSIAGDDAALAALNLTAEQVRNIQIGLQNATLASKVAGKEFLMTGQQINQMFAQHAAGAIDKFAQAVAEGKNVFASLKEAFLQFAADFLRQIAQMIIQQAIFNALGGGGAAGNSKGFGAGLAGLITGLFHEGGVVGESGGARLASPEWFRNAMRYHTGGIAGLKPNEVPAILERGEEVLTADDPRHINNGGATPGAPSQGGVSSVTVVNTFDPADVLEKALSTSVGEKVFLNYVQQNSGAFRAAIG